MKCTHCNGECCYLDSREGTIRYAQILTHGKGAHFCKYCDDGTEKEEINQVKNYIRTFDDEEGRVKSPAHPKRPKRVAQEV